MAVAADAPPFEVSPSLDDVKRLAADFNVIPLRTTFIDDVETPVSASEIAEASASAGAPPAAPTPEPVAVVLTPPTDPSRPKRAGWWSRTKAALTGE